MNPPARNAVLWRYIDFTKFVSLLDRGTLFFSRADRLGDPFEGSLSPWNSSVRSASLIEQGVPHDLIPEFNEAVSSSQRKVPLLMVVNCWHENVYESEAMWKVYATGQNGIAIKTTFSKLAESLVCEEPIFIGTVSYVDYDSTPIPERNIMEPLLTKRTSFSHEREVRALALNFPSPDDHIGRYFEVDLATLIGEVLIAPQAPDWFVELVKAVAGRYGLQAPVLRSSLAAAPTW